MCLHIYCSHHFCLCLLFLLYLPFLLVGSGNNRQHKKFIWFLTFSQPLSLNVHAVAKWFFFFLDQIQALKLSYHKLQLNNILCNDFYIYLFSIPQTTVFKTPFFFMSPTNTIAMFQFGIALFSKFRISSSSSKLKIEILLNEKKCKSCSMHSYNMVSMLHILSKVYFLLFSVYHRLWFCLSLYYILM